MNVFSFPVEAGSNAESNIVNHIATTAANLSHVEREAIRQNCGNNEL